jgi:endo-1,4-beta-xylanase
MLTLNLKQRANFRPTLIAGFVFLLAIAGVWFINGSVRSSETTPGKDINLLAAGWNYMPGADIQPDGLHIHHLGRAIVQQNGADGQLNPPVNLYGTRLSMTGDFSISATMKDIKGVASLQLYGDAPVIQDEFRIEPKSIRLSISGQTLSVHTWNGYKNQNVYQQIPATTKQYIFKPQASNTISLQRQNGQVDIAINNTHITTITPDKIFGSAAIWFGTDAENLGDSWTLAALSAKPLDTGTVAAINTQILPVVSKDTQNLQQLAQKKRPGFLVGTAMALSPAVADMKYHTIAYGGNFGAMTTENVLKWQFIHPQPQTYDFHEADALVALANKNGLATNGHTLVFGEANPKWVQDLPTTTKADKQRVREVMLDHIAQTVGHFKDQVATWDVVNEPLADYDSPANADGLRQHKWYAAMGENYIASAFTAARQADPKAKLYINEFGLEADGERWDTFLALVTKLKSNGVPIDGVGFQAHVYASGDKIDSTVLRAHIRALARLGLTARISEMDVFDGDGTAAQAQQYANVFDACINEPSCVSWTTWGISDRYNLWLSDNGRQQTGHDFLWTDTYEPTAAVGLIRKNLTK